MKRQMDPPVGTGRVGGILLLVWACVSSLSAQAPVRPGPILTLVSAKSIPSNFLGPQAVYADKDRIYLASYQGKLFVLARDRAAGFPLVEIVDVSTLPLTAVRGDERFVYVTSGEGTLATYRNRAGRPLELVGRLPLSSFGLSSLALFGNVYVARGQAQMEVNKRHLFLSELNPGDVALEIDQKGIITQTYGTAFEGSKTVVFERKTGQHVGEIANPLDIRGFSSQQVALYIDPAERVLAQTTPGCCGTGIYLSDPDTLLLQQYIPRWFANTVVVTPDGQWLIAGGEDGRVDLFDLKQNPSPFVVGADLRTLTGHTNPGDIEIRALWLDHWDNLVFAGSSGGNDQTRGPDLPSFFVLEIVTRR